MAPLIPIALQLAQLAPVLMRHFGVGEDKAETAEAVVELAKQVTGAESPADALIALKANAELRAQFAEHAMELDARLEEAYLSDTQNARQRDTAFVQAGVRNIRADLMTLAAYILVGGLVWMVWRESDMSEFTKGVVTLVLGRFLGYLDNMHNFEFGTTRDSKLKSGTIDALARK